MHIKIIGCPDKEFRPFVKRATQFFSDCLLSKRMQENTSIKIKFTNKIDDCGSAMIEGYNLQNKPRSFIIEVNSDMGAKDILYTLAHELVHVRQYAYGHTNESLSKWHDLKIDSDKVDYWYQPWEVEAFGLEKGLLTKFATEEKLWDVFAEFRNPEKKLKKDKIIWKKSYLDKKVL